ncbi:MAG: transketolase family protein [Nitrososphaerota archaeon]|jgi:transketolase|nr:transketolase family protein [Nitrososphaerota archaeon]MDG6942080.1 transketolase family protein [Nitrososphaerota archaeon]MDG6942545.1 transketolase family protein [Nitrososphaerota archaeon]MDG6948332.1 transketolase family protein [Nitrososphaerota archaeon]MDG6950258.1 transketolase family protein [Nitrososphaerota archaeon]
MLSKTAAMRDAYGDALLELGAENKDVVVVGADTTGSLKSGVFATKFPERFFNVGIAEQNLVSIAAGMALAGKIAYAGTYAIFVPGKSVDQIRNNIAYPNLDVKIVCSHGGISVGPDGASHQQVEDIAIMRAVPKMKVIVPSDAVSTKASIKAIATIPGPFYVRLTRSSTPVVYDAGFQYELGRANVLREGGDVAIVACGIMVPEALKAAESLSSKGVSASVVDLHTIKPIDSETLVKLARKCGRVVTAEEHNIMGGMGSAVAEVLGERYPVPMRRVGVMDTFGESGEAGELLRKYGLTAANIEQASLGLKGQ